MPGCANPTAALNKANAVQYGTTAIKTPDSMSITIAMKNTFLRPILQRIDLH